MTRTADAINRDPAPAPSDPDCEAVTHAFARLGLDRRIASIRPLGLHASAKRHFRVLQQNGDTLIVLRGCSPDTDYLAAPPPCPERLPFVTIGRWLDERGVRVPRIFAHFEDIDCIVLEDLGDTTARDALAGASAERAAALLEAAMRTIQAIQVLSPLVDRELPEIAGRVFDRATTRWELEHFREWCLCGYLGVDLKPSAARALDLVFDEIAGWIDAEGRVLAHRDFHLANLMVSDDGRLAVIDFQDLAMCSPVYDAASFIFDAEVIDGDMRDAAIEAWRRSSPHAARDAAASRRSVEVHGLQRCLKNAGRFAWLAANWGKREFLAQIPATLALIRDTASRFDEFTDLVDLLDEVPASRTTTRTSDW